MYPPDARFDEVNNRLRELELQVQTLKTVLEIVRKVLVDPNGIYLNGISELIRDLLEKV